MSCKSPFSTPVTISLYADNVVTFDRPFTAFAPIVSSAYATIATGQTGTKLIVSEFTRLEVSPTTTVAGTKRTVVIEYDVDQTDATDAIQQLTPFLHGNYHARVSFLNGAIAWVRSTPKAFSLQYEETDGRLHVTITIDTVSGIQRISD